MKVIGFITATVWEAKPVLSALRLIKTSDNRFEAPLPNGDAVLSLMICGMGQENAKLAAQALAGRNASLIISYGYGGALQPGLEPGDLAVDISRSDAQWVETIGSAAKKLNLRMHCGNFLSVNSALSTAQQKKLAGEKTGNIVVETESQAILDVCRVQKIPFGSIRAVSDSLDQDLPAAALAVNGDGKLPLGVWKLLLLRPNEWGDLIRLSRSAGKANRSLVKLFSLYFSDPISIGAIHEKK